MNEYYAYELLEKKVSLLKEEGRDKEILILLKVFSEALDLVEEVIPFPGNNEVSPMAINLKVRFREKLLIELMEPFFDFQEKTILIIPISLN